MLIQSEALILQTTKYGDSSLIVKLFTPDYGVLSFIVNGIRPSAKRNKQALFRPLTYVNFVCLYRENKNLQRFKEVERSVVYQSLPFDVIKSAIAIFLLEILARSVKEAEIQDQLYYYTKDRFAELDAAFRPDPNFHLYTLLYMTSLLGFAPQGTCSEELPYFNMMEGQFVAEYNTHNYSLDKEESGWWSALLDRSLNSLSRKNRQKLTHGMVTYYALHLEGFGKVKSLPVIEAILNG